MASYRPFPPQSSFAPSPTQNPLPLPPPQQQQQRPNQYNQNYPQIAPPQPPQAAAPSSFPQNYTQMPSNYHYPPSRPQHQHQHPHPPPPPPQYSYIDPPPPPPPDSSYPPPPPPPPQAQNSMPPQHQPPMHYSQYGNQPAKDLQPPPPPPPASSPPLSSSFPPPPPPSSPPPPPSSPQPPPPPKESGLHRGSNVRDKGREHGNLIHGVGSKQQQIPQVHVPPMAKKSNGLAGRMETEEERRLRKKREYEKQRQEEGSRQQFKESQNTILQKTQMMPLGTGHGSVVGSRMGDRRATSFFSGERIENRLKKPTTFLCKLK